MDLRIPHRFTLLGREWTVSRPETLTVDGNECDGVCVLEEMAIGVRADLKGERALRRLVHEMLHAEFPEDVVSDRAEEIIVNALALPVLDIARALTAEEP